MSDVADTIRRILIVMLAMIIGVIIGKYISVNIFEGHALLTVLSYIAFAGCAVCVCAAMSNRRES